MITEVLDEKLDVGDYGARFTDGHEPPFYFDRKSIPDLFGTLGTGYERFKKCIIRAQETNKQLFIIVEGTLSDVIRGHEHSSIEGISIVRKMFTLWVRYGVGIVFVADRSEMSKYITEFFIAVGKKYVRDGSHAFGVKEKAVSKETNPKCNARHKA